MGGKDGPPGSSGDAGVERFCCWLGNIEPVMAMWVDPRANGAVGAKRGLSTGEDSSREIRGWHSPMGLATEVIREVQLNE